MDLHHALLKVWFYFMEVAGTEWPWLGIRPIWMYIAPLPFIAVWLWESFLTTLSSSIISQIGIMIIVLNRIVKKLNEEMCLRSSAHSPQQCIINGSHSVLKLVAILPNQMANSRPATNYLVNSCWNKGRVCLGQVHSFLKFHLHSIVF